DGRVPLLERDELHVALGALLAERAGVVEVPERGERHGRHRPPRAGIQDMEIGAPGGRSIEGNEGHEVFFAFVTFDVPSAELCALRTRTSGSGGSRPGPPRRTPGGSAARTASRG